jgi:hypothetical protein
MPFIVSRMVYRTWFGGFLPQTEVVGKVKEGGDGRAGGDEKDFEGCLLRVGQGAALDTVCALEVCELLAS